MKLTSAGVDIGIVVRDGAAALAFYRDLLGMRHEGDNPVPFGGQMHRLFAGETMVKIVVPDEPPPVDAADGGIPAATGIRYLTLSVSNLDEILDACEAASVPIVRPATTMGAGVRIAIVADPEGNLVEFLERE
jgi:catechol 2,3-dioxygenase-like lactoylglutathione lyase family enzyme